MVFTDERGGSEECGEGSGKGWVDDSGVSDGGNGSERIHVDEEDYLGSWAKIVNTSFTRRTC